MFEATSTCQNCGVFYRVPSYRIPKSKYCGKSCRSSAIAKKHLNTGLKPWAAKNLEGHRHKSSSRFKSGHKSWNKGVKGIHLSPETEFKAGRDSEKALHIGAVTIRRDGSGRPRAWVKSNAGWRPRAQVVYAAKHGGIPEGKVVHHIDGDCLNDRPQNLEALTPSEHIAAHREELKGSRNA